MIISADIGMFFIWQLPFIIIFLPWFLAWRSWVLIVGTVTCFFLLYPETNNPGVGHAFGLVFLYFLYFIISGFLLLRLLLYYVITSNKLPFIKIHKNILIASNIITSAYVGALLSLFIIKFIVIFYSGRNNGFLIHDYITISAFAFALTFFTLLFIKQKIVTFLLCIALFSAGISIFTISLIGKQYPKIVIASAKDRAQENPYCIELYKRKRPLQSLEDLTLFTMDKNNFVNHVILLVDDNGEIKPYHWSYESGIFEQGAYGWNGNQRPNISCSPTLNFIDKIILKTKYPE